MSDHHEVHVAAHLLHMQPFDFVRLPERNSWRERLAHALFRRPLPMTRERARAAMVAINEHVREHGRLVDEMSGVHPISRGPAGE